MKGYALLLAVAAAGAHLVHRGLDRLEVAHPLSLKETLPSEEALQLLSLGYKSAAADYYWLRAIYEFGDPTLSRAKYPNLVALTERVLALDPYYVTAYQFAGTALTVHEIDPRFSIDILKRGLEYRPDAWQVPFLLGFNLFYFEHDYAAAAEALAKAAMLPGAPEISGPLATRLAAQAGRPEIGLSLVDFMLESTQDEKLRTMYAERRRLLQLEAELNWLGAALQQYNARAHEPATSLDDLRRAGLIPDVAADPLGGKYFIDGHGKIATTSDAKRLRLGPRATGANP